MAKRNEDKPKPQMPRAPLKLASVEDVSRYLTTVTKMLHNDLISPAKANSLKGLCMAKIDSLKKNKETQQSLIINIGCRMGLGPNKAKKLAEVEDTTGNISTIQINQQPELIELKQDEDAELKALTADIEEALNDE